MTGEDHLAIQTLYARYNQCADRGDAEGWAACFTLDGEIRLAGRGASARGRAALVEFQRQSTARRGAQYRRHWSGSLLVEADGPEAARGRAYFQAFNGLPGELPTLTDAGVYEDRLVRTAAGWRFAERVVHFDGRSSG